MNDVGNAGGTDSWSRRSALGVDTPAGPDGVRLRPRAASLLVRRGRAGSRPFVPSGTRPHALTGQRIMATPTRSLSLHRGLRRAWLAALLACANPVEIENCALRLRPRAPRLRAVVRRQHYLWRLTPPAANVSATGWTLVREAAATWAARCTSANVGVGHFGQVEVHPQPRRLHGAAKQHRGPGVAVQALRLAAAGGTPAPVPTSRPRSGMSAPRQWRRR